MSGDEAPTQSCLLARTNTGTWFNFADSEFNRLNSSCRASSKRLESVLSTTNTTPSVLRTYAFHSGRFDSLPPMSQILYFSFFVAFTHSTLKAIVGCTLISSLSFALYIRLVFPELSNPTITIWHGDETAEASRSRETTKRFPILLI